jgi:hypothetical protein
VVALDTADSDDTVRTLRNGICHKKFELPNFVAAQLHASQIIPLQFPNNLHMRVKMQYESTMKHLKFLEQIIDPCVSP